MAGKIIDKRRRKKAKDVGLRETGNTLRNRGRNIDDIVSGAQTGEKPKEKK